MKKLFVALLILMLIVMPCAVLANGGSDNGNSGSDSSDDSGSDDSVSDDDRSEDSGKEVETEHVTEVENETEHGIELEVRKEERPREQEMNETELREHIQEHEQELERELEQIREEERSVYRDQDRVRLAVEILLSLDNTTGIGRNVSVIAREFNNSVEATVRAEEEIRTRNSIIRFFAGGDYDAADRIEQEVSRNEVRIQEMNRLVDQCECSEAARELLREQIRNMELEQERLQELARKEKSDTGLFGWLLR